MLVNNRSWLWPSGSFRRRAISSVRGINHVDRITDLSVCSFTLLGDFTYFTSSSHRPLAHEVGKSTVKEGRFATFLKKLKNG